MAAAPNTAETVSIENIDQERAGILKRVLFGILRTDAAKKVIAQAIDGLPIEDMYELNTTKRFDLLQRLEPSPSSMVRAGQFCTYSEMFDDLELNARVAHLYQLAPLGSLSGARLFNMHLLELAAIALHDFIGNLFIICHPNGEPPQDEKYNDPIPEGAISLSTPCYTRSDQYPKGVADVVGYWAETHLFGGVVVFHRGKIEGARASWGAFIHPPSPASVFQLLDYQLTNFASIGTENGTATLPFTYDPKAPLIDPVDAFLEYNIYRDRFERVGNEDENASDE